jgi:hypothetical protein
MKNNFLYLALTAVTLFIGSHAHAAKRHCARNGMGDIQCCESYEKIYKNGMGDVVCRSKALKCVKNGMGDVQCCERNEEIYRNGMGDIVCR